MPETKEQVEAKTNALHAYLSNSDDDDDDFNYEEIPDSDDDELEFVTQHDTLASIKQSIRRVDAGLSKASTGLGSQSRADLPEEAGKETTGSSSGSNNNNNNSNNSSSNNHISNRINSTTGASGSSADVQTIVRPAVVDDFIRNFFNKMNMFSSLDAFNTEWFELKAKGKLGDEDISTVPDIYLRNEDMDQQIKLLREELEKMKAIAEKAQSTWDRFRKERNFHRMHHKRVVQEKNKLVTDIKRLKKHFAAYEPTLAELKRKYELAMKEKMLMRLERDRLALKASALEQQIATIEGADGSATGVGHHRQQQQQLSATGQGDLTVATKGTTNGGGSERKTNSSSNNKNHNNSSSNRQRRTKGGVVPIPDHDAVNPYAQSRFEPSAVGNFQLNKTFKGHVNSVSAVAFHPKKNIVATASDDETWKLWSMPNGELIMSGEGHESWVSSLAFHPRGSHLVTASGDGAVKLWDFAQAKCTGTFVEHTQAVWDVTFHYTGDFVASCSMDHTAKLLDAHTLKTRQTLRGHVDAVNSVAFQPYTNNLCTGSGDKTVSLWDTRSGLCIQTFYGHTNACNSVTFNLQGDAIASCDADGVVKVWDVRMIAERASISESRYPLNSVSFDPSGDIVAAASDDGTVKLFNVQGEQPKHVCNFSGHEDAVQTACFSLAGDALVTGASDCTFRLWSQ